MESRARTFFKTVSWRFFATLITSLVVWAVTGKVELGLSVATLDCVIKLVAYYFHERVWNAVSYGYNEPRRLPEPAAPDARGSAQTCASRRHPTRAGATNQVSSSKASSAHLDSHVGEHLGGGLGEHWMDALTQAEPV